MEICAIWLAGFFVVVGCIGMDEELTFCQKLAIALFSWFIVGAILKDIHDEVCNKNQELREEK